MVITVKGMVLSLSPDSDGFFNQFLFDPEHRGITFLHNASKLNPDYTVSHPITQFSSVSSN
jgi:hypothetical protein